MTQGGTRAEALPQRCNTTMTVTVVQKDPMRGDVGGQPWRETELPKRWVNVEKQR